MGVIETYTAPKGHTIEVYYAVQPENPREWDTIGTLAIRHIGDEEPDPDFDLSDYVWLPVYRYEHSGVAFNTTGFHCPWDSGLTGYIYAPKGVEGMTEDQILNCLRQEVAVFSQWANGEVYGYITKDADDEEVDSCWGFYGFDHEESGLLDHAQECIQ